MEEADLDSVRLLFKHAGDLKDQTISTGTREPSKDPIGPLLKNALESEAVELDLSYHLVEEFPEEFYSLTKIVT